MQPQPMMMNLVRFLHNLFTALWIGGMFTLLISVIPGVKKNPGVDKPMPIINGIQRRMKAPAIAAMIVLAGTGILLGRASKNFSGLFNFGTPYMTAMSIKHILMILMVVVALLRLSINKKLETNPEPGLQKTSLAVLALNVVLGAAVLFLSSMV